MIRVTYKHIVDSPVGKLLLISDGEHLIGCYFNDGDAEDTDEGTDDAVLTRCAAELDAYFNGTLKAFTVPIKTDGTAFQQRVWAELTRIPYGETISYRELAARAGNPKAVRAAGGANHRNPVSILIPCHRVIGADGKLTGYGGGLDKKAFLLAHERRYNY